MTPKTSNASKALAGGHFLMPNCFFEPVCVKLSLSVWPVRVRKNKKVGRKARRQEGRKVTRSVYFTYAWSDP